MSHSPENRISPAGNRANSESDHTGSGICEHATARADLSAELSRVALGAVLVASPDAQADAVRLLPVFRDPVLEWCRAALVAAVEQNATSCPATIAAAADRARVATPPAIATNRIGFLHDLVLTAPAPMFLPVLLDEMAEAELRQSIAAHGRRLIDGAHRGDLAEQIAQLELGGPLIDRCKSLAVAR